MCAINIKVHGSVCCITTDMAGSVRRCWLLIVPRCVRNCSIVASVYKEGAVAGLWHVVLGMGVLKWG